LTSTDINSQDYWNGRFETDWESNLGKEQSRFFARVALDTLPAWLRSAANQDGWTVCDWGCAQGDGTDVMASYFSREHVIGVDFAEAAVEKARAAYPSVRFEAQDWIAHDDVNEKFSMIFSSNTLEHFHDPFTVLSKLFNHAEHCVVLALPYRELSRISEHFFTFTPENIPLVADEDWVLAYARAVDCRPMEPTYWHGDQVILVYVNRAWAQAKKLALADGLLGAETPPLPLEDLTSAKIDLLRSENALLADELSALKVQLEQHFSQQAALNQAREADVQRLDEERRQLAAERDAMAKELSEIKSSNSWRMMSPMRNLRKKFKN
jgi:hypothetical protein